MIGIELTREQALALYATNWWRDLNARAVAEFQLSVHTLCMPFSEYHAAVSLALGRDVYTHEFVDPETLLRELSGDKPSPTIADILRMLPADKRVVVVR